MRAEVGAGVSGVSLLELLELLLLLLELLSGASPGISGALVVGNGCSLAAEGVGALGPGALGVVALGVGAAGVGAAGGGGASPGNGNCRAGEEGVAGTGAVDGGVDGVLWARHAVESAATARKARNGVRANIRL